MSAVVPEHPGESLARALEAMGMSQAELARRLGYSTKHVNQVIQGTSGLGPGMAVRLEDITGVPGEFWASAQARYDVAVAREAWQDALQREKLIAEAQREAVAKVLDVEGAR